METSARRTLRMMAKFNGQTNAESYVIRRRSLTFPHLESDFTVAEIIIGNLISGFFTFAFLQIPKFDLDL